MKIRFKRPLLVFIFAAMLVMALIAGLFSYYFPRGSIILQPIGGMGNQMFQYAAAYSFAKSTGSKLYVIIDKESEKKGNVSMTDRNSALTQFQIPEEEIIRDGGVAKFLVKIIKRIKFADKIFRVIDINEANFTATKVLGKIGKSFVMRSYFESEEFFVDHRDEIKRIFNIDDTKYVRNLRDNPLNAEKVHSTEDIVSANGAVCVHVRRGDSTGLLSIPIDYQKKAIDLVRKLIPNPQFYIFSDDPELVKSEIGTYSDVVYANNNNSLPMEDFYLMSKCSANIISNSTFSWWAAYLNKRNMTKDIQGGHFVIAPYPRFTDDALKKTVAPSELDVWLNIIGKKESYPSDWILLHHLDIENAGKSN